MRDLEIEKKKTDTLLYSMLPKEVANDLREGRPVEAGKYMYTSFTIANTHF